MIHLIASFNIDLENSKILKFQNNQLQIVIAQENLIIENNQQHLNA